MLNIKISLVEILGNNYSEEFAIKIFDGFILGELKKLCSIEELNNMIDTFKIKATNEGFLKGSIYKITSIDFDLR